MVSFPLAPATRERLQRRLEWMVAREERLAAREGRTAHAQELREQIVQLAKKAPRRFKCFSP